MKHIFAFVVLFTTFNITMTDLHSFCSLPMDEGTGAGHRTRLYYDPAKDQCLPFRYLGEGGNANRFITDKMCMRNCSATADQLYPMDETKACLLKKAIGHCLSHYLLWYYDPVDGRCKNFYYSGCGGNGNRFVGQQICNNTCFGIELDNPVADQPKADDEESDTPAGLIIGIILGVVGAIIIIAMVVISVKNKKSKSPSKDMKETDVPLQDKRVEML